MKKHTHPLEPDRIYHIYNRGINGENIFKEERNYRYFLEKYAKCISPIADTYAYCLLKNHFHLAVKIKTEQEILAFYRAKKISQMKQTSFLTSGRFKTSPTLKMTLKFQMLRK
jgi:REP element-mobilizing transposase RayT